MSERRCHWTKDDRGSPVMIPECFGGAHDPEACTCEVFGSELDRAREALREAEERIARMVDATRQQNNRYAQLFNANRQLRDRVSENSKLRRSNFRAPRCKQASTAVTCRRVGGFKVEIEGA